MPNNKAMADARVARNNEFYTQITDIEKETRCYSKAYFRDKVVYCNCDDPRVSNFYRHFKLKFHHYGLKRLIATCYRSQQPDVFSANDSERAVSIEYAGRGRGRVIDLKGDGDFRNPESIALMERSDVVVTNPPFSLFKEFLTQLEEYGKRFLILGNLNVTGSKVVFPMFMREKVWYGPSIFSGDREFQVPDHYPLEAAKTRVDAEGRRFVRVKGVRWFTNMKHKKRQEELILHRRYKAAEYPEYDNYDAIEVGRTADIPCDHKGIMGVPLTFFDKHCPAQFEIVGVTNLTGLDNGHWNGKHGRGPVIKTNGKLRRVYQRVLIRNKGL